MSIRAEIDRLDREIISLLLDRLSAAAAIGELRLSEGVTRIGEHDRGNQVLARYRSCALSPDGARAVTLEAVGRAILALSVTVQNLILDRGISPPNG